MAYITYPTFSYIDNKSSNLDVNILSDEYEKAFGESTKIFSPNALDIISTYKTISDSITFKQGYELELSEYLKKFPSHICSFPTWSKKILIVIISKESNEIFTTGIHHYFLTFNNNYEFVKIS